MILTCVYDNINRRLTIPPEVLPETGAQSHHFQSTDSDNLVELAGRICYDSCKGSKTRDSKDYHENIRESKHTSVWGHVNFSFIAEGFRDNPDLLNRLCINRPGVFVDYNPLTGVSKIHLNARAINEWAKYPIQTASLSDIDRNDGLMYDLMKSAHYLCPLAVQAPDEGCVPFKSDLIEDPAIESRNVWYTFYIGGVSRNLSHELITHSWKTCRSQRSTRYVDESASEWAYHPLFKKIINNVDDFGTFSAHEKTSKLLYQVMASAGEQELQSLGVDKFTARKQSRAAARGVLGSCLSTEMIWSVRVDQALNICEQRCSESADAEIRIFANKLFDFISMKHPELTEKYSRVTCKDGFGYGLATKGFL